MLSVFSLHKNKAPYSYKFYHRRVCNLDNQIIENFHHFAEEWEKQFLTNYV